MTLKAIRKVKNPVATHQLFFFLPKRCCFDLFKKIGVDSGDPVT
jgi:hypothetical protein